MSAPRLQISHLVLGLDCGGAETVLMNLLRHRQAPGLSQVVVNAGRPGAFYEDEAVRLADAYELCDVRRRPLSALLRIRRTLRESDAAVLWLYKGCLLGTAVLGRSANVPLVWCIRHAQLDARHNTRSVLRAARQCARLSERADAILYNGERARAVNEAFGFDPMKGFVIENGVDVEKFRPRVSAKERLAAELGVSPQSRIVLSTSRFHPIKDLPTLAAALAPVQRDHQDVVAVLAGAGVEAGDAQLEAMLRENGVDRSRVFLLGTRDDVALLYAAADVFVLSSAGEAFPNALVEAMASGAVCVTTDVGDVARMLGSRAFVAPPRDPAALAMLLDGALNLEPEHARRIGWANRQRVEQRYGMEIVVSRYEQAFVRAALQGRAAANGRGVR